MALNVELLRGSFALVAEREPELTHRFYDNLFATYPAAQPLFSRRTRQDQEKMLRDMLVAVIDHLEDASWLTSQENALEVVVAPRAVIWLFRLQAILACIAAINKSENCF